MLSVLSPLNLPYTRNQAIANSPRVVSVAGKISLECAILECSSSQEKQRHDEEWNGKSKKTGAAAALNSYCGGETDVAGMLDECIRSKKQTKLKSNR